MNSEAASGGQSVLLLAGTPQPRASVQIPSVPNESVVYVDLYARPAADPVVDNSSVIEAGPARIGFLLNSGLAVVEAFNGNGLGGGHLDPPHFRKS